MSQRAVRVAIGVAGLVWSLASEAVYYRAGTSARDVLLDLAIGWTYLYGGLALWESRPHDRMGRAMTLVGLTWFIGNVALSDIPWLSQLGTLFSGVAAAALVALILAYPSGRLETRADRTAVVIVSIGWLAIGAIQVLPAGQNPAIAPWLLPLNGILAAFAGVVVIRRWVRAPRRRRPELLPVLLAGSVQMAVLVMFMAIQILFLPERLEALLIAAKDLAPVAIPLGLLVGIYRQSESRQRALVDAMPDAMIRVTTSGRYLDARAHDGALVTIPTRSVVGGRIDDILPADSVSAVMAAAAKAIECGELQTVEVTVDSPTGRRDFEARITRSGSDEVTAIVRDFTAQRAAQSEVRFSRTRIIEAADAERRRLERDLHDGAQQRLMSLSLAIRLARSRLGTDVDGIAAAALSEAAGQLRTAIVELRELARGIHPAILTAAGLGAAIDTLAARSNVRVDVLALPDRRLSPAVEATAYFVVSEALANVAKDASATNATVSAQCPGSSLRVEVVDDGAGGAYPAGASGLAGLTDRIAALGGTLSVITPTGGGTRVVAEIPLGI